MILRAKFLVPTADRVIENGAVAIHNDVLSAVGEFPAVSRTTSGPVCDLGNSVILPGLVNAHTHLELSGLRGAVPFRGSFADWLMTVRTKRSEQTPTALQNGAWEGVRESIAAGTTTIGDYTQLRASVKPMLASGLRGVLFFETVGFLPRVAFRRATMVAWNLWWTKSSRLVKLAVAPHAPYSVSQELYVRLWRIARKRGLLFSTHVNECKEEIEFFEHGRGELRTMLTNLGLMWDGWKPPGMCPLRYLNAHGLIDSETVLIHCNYLSDGDCQIIASKGAGVVYCPRSHAFLGHSDHSFEKLLTLGVPVALGTDSLVSNETLSILDEMRFMAVRSPKTAPSQFVRMATEYGARVLHLEDRIGQIREGLQADITAIALPAGYGDPFEGIMQVSARPILTMVAGETLYAAG